MGTVPCGSSIEGFGFPDVCRPTVSLCINHYCRNMFKYVTSKMKAGSFVSRLQGICTTDQLWRLCYNFAAALRTVMRGISDAVEIADSLCDDIRTRVFKHVLYHCTGQHEHCHKCPAALAEACPAAALPWCAACKLRASSEKGGEQELNVATAEAADELIDSIDSDGDSQQEESAERCTDAAYLGKVGDLPAVIAGTVKVPFDQNGAELSRQEGRDVENRIAALKEVEKEREKQAKKYQKHRIGEEKQRAKEANRIERERKKGSNKRLKQQKGSNGKEAKL